MKELIGVKVYIVFFDDMDNWCIEKICKNEADAMAYCKKMNDELPYDFYHYEERELE